MPPALGEISISFGMVHNPTKIITAAGEKSICTVQIHSSYGPRIKKRRRCPKVDCPVERDEIRRRVEYSKSRYVRLSEEDFSKNPPETTRKFELPQFAQLAEIDPVCDKQTNDLAPRQVGGKAFQLLLEALNSSVRVGIGKLFLREREQLVFLRHFGRAEPFHPEQYQDRFQAVFQRLIGQKIHGQEVVIPLSPEPRIQDLMAAWQKSLEETGIRNEQGKQRAST